MIHTAHGWWLADAGPVEPAPPLRGDVSADVVIVGGGYTGLWTAWQLLERGARVVVLEAGVCGHGPSGRNGGFCETLWSNLPALIARFGPERALAAARASSKSVAAIGAWCEAQAVDAWFHRAGFLLASTAEAHDAVIERVLDAARAVGAAAPEAGGSAAPLAGGSAAPLEGGSAAPLAGGSAAPLEGGSAAPLAGGSAAPLEGGSAAPLAGGSAELRVVALDRDGLRARCASPRFRRGLFVPDDATLHPARLALGLRARVIARGARVFERSRVRALRVGADVLAETDGGRVRAGAAVLAVNAATRGVPPLRHRLAVTSSHIVLTEPVPDAIEALNWTGGESITDARTFVHYFRTTRDGRIAFGWGGGRLAAGARLSGRVEVDPAVAHETRRHLEELLPPVAGRRITHAWGGPIDVSPSHLPQVGTLDGAPVHFAFGFTGNGVGPSHLAGRALAARAAGERPDVELPGSDPVAVPPEPLAWAGGMVVRAAFLRRERLEAAGRRPDPLTRAVCAAPRALGIHVGR